MKADWLAKKMKWNEEKDPENDISKLTKPSVHKGDIVIDLKPLEMRTFLVHIN